MPPSKSFHFGGFPWSFAVLVLSLAACAASEAPKNGIGGAGGATAAPGGSGGGGSTSSAGGQMTEGGGTGGSSVAGAPGGAGGATADAGVDGSDGGAPEGGAGDGGLMTKPPPMPSLGCNKVPAQAFASYVRHTVTNSTRVYDLRLPTGYDMTRAYPLVFLAHGCDGSIPYPMEQATKGDAILVALRSKDSQNSGMLYGGGCFDTMNPNSPEVPYYDQVLKDVEGLTCVDEARVFLIGHSSGSWLSNLIGCARGSVTLRAQANTTGGLPPGIPACSGPVAAMMMHDTTDTMNPIAGGEMARDRILAINKCGTDTKPYDWDGDPKTPSVCVEYQGCLPGFPVVWCPTTGLGHSPQVPMSTVGTWRFWSQF
ncbi:MAG TPA: hypothetical protein VHJ20_23540 [Polyangia bacterium]|nr:hypothetical protein [Polyangia bacterium]